MNPAVEPGLVEYKINRSQEFLIGGYTAGNPFMRCVGCYDGLKLKSWLKLGMGFVPHALALCTLCSKNSRRRNVVLPIYRRSGKRFNLLPETKCGTTSG